MSRVEPVEAPRLAPYAPTIPQMLRHIAGLYGKREALVRSQTRVTFSDLERRSARLARGLLAQGVGKGTKIALLLPNSPEFVVFFMAAARIGAIVAPLSTLYQGPELAWVLNHADIDVLVTIDRYLNHDYLARLEQVFRQLAGQGVGRLALPGAPYLRRVLVWGACDRSWAAPAEDSLEAAADARPEIDDAFLAAVEANVTPADPLCMIHTSGSTANPKGVVHGHGPMIRHSYQMSHDFWGAGEGDRLVSMRPFFWVAGLSATLFHSLHTGCCLITPPDTSAATVRRMIETEGATAITGDDTLFRTLAEAPELTGAGYGVYRISLDVAAFAKAGEAGVRFLNPTPAGRQGPPRHYPTERFARSFGMTEALGAHTSSPPDELLPPDRPRYCGRGVPGTILKIVDPQTRQPLPPGEVGELLIGGYSLMQGLYKAERSEVFRPDGLYPTGDLCLIDSEGYLAFSARRGEMIKVHGANVAPLEVEMCLNSLPQIDRSAVLAVETDGGKNLLVAAVQLRPGETFHEPAIRGELRGRLSSFKVPGRLFALAAEEFPLTGSGKVKKSALRDLLAERLRAEPAAVKTPADANKHVSSRTS